MTSRGHLTTVWHLTLDWWYAFGVSQPWKKLVGFIILLYFIFFAAAWYFQSRIFNLFLSKINILGTIFLELWKRENAELAYEWDVEQFELNEPDRPEFIGTKQKQVMVVSFWKKN